ncbi:MAG: UDP-N-acetylmuramoyl-L-alanine--D-glutamate ligase [Paracoccaceae bacterium]
MDNCINFSNDWPCYTQSPMISIDEYTNKVVLILGFGRTGTSLAAALIASGSKVWIWDDDPAVLLSAEQNGFKVFNPKKDKLWSTIDLLLVSPGISTLNSTAHKFVLKARSLEIFVDNDIGLFFRILRSTKRRFTIPPTIIAITGSNGKSTTASLIHHILFQSGMKSQIAGNIGKGVFELKPLQNQEIVVLELSSYQLESASYLSPDIAVFTNFSPDHLERHGGLKGYFEAKKRLFQEGLPSASIINTNSVEGKELFLINEQLSKTCSVSSQKNQHFQSIQYGNKNLSARSNGKKKFSANLAQIKNLPGSHNHENISLAYACCRAVGLDNISIMEAVKSFEGLPHRLQHVRVKAGVTYINDSKATNIDSVVKALCAFNNIHWICGGQEKAGSMGLLRQNSKSIKRAYIIGKNPKRFASKIGEIPYILCGSMQDAVKYAGDTAVLGDTVLLSPGAASFDQYEDFEKRGEHFVKLVKELL